MGRNSAAEEATENPHERIHYETLPRLALAVRPIPHCLACVADICNMHLAKQFLSVFDIQRIVDISECSCIYRFFVVTLHTLFRLSNGFTLVCLIV